MLIHWIWLATRKGMGDHTRMALLSRFQDAEAVYFAQKSELAEMEQLSAAAAESLGDKDLTESNQIVQCCTDERIHILTWQDAAYPNRLRNIPDPPVVLYYKGTIPDLDDLPAIGVVGTREASPYGLQTAKRMGYQIASCGGLVVSGLADGIDAMAMKGALTAGSPVVGVLGCGADIVYPLCNRALFADTERYGCILTEFPPRTPPIGSNFPRRNRIISGLSCGVLVIEAPERSGALITARRAADQGRDVFVVPGNIDVATCVGSNALMRDGATPVTCGWDVLCEYAPQFPGKLRPDGKKSRMEVYPEELSTAEKPAPKAKKQKPSAPVKAPKAKKGIDNGRDDAYIDLTKAAVSLSDDEQTIVDLLGGGQRLVDDVIAESGKPAGVVLAALTMLEVKGVVRRLPGRLIALTGK